MKKIILSLAVAVAAISCNNVEETFVPEVDPNTISIDVLSTDVDNASTRIVTTDEGSEWVVKWANNDQIFGWSMSEDGVTKDENISTFKMQGMSDDQLTATFSGTAKNDKIRFIHKINNAGYQANDEAIQINYAAQTVDMNNPTDALKYAVLITEDLVDVASLVDGTVTPAMTHTGAGMKLDLAFTGLPAENDYKITQILVGNSAVTDGYTLPTQLIKVRPEYAIDSEDFYMSKAQKQIKLTVNNSPNIEIDKKYSFYFNIFEFEVPNNNKIQITVTLSATNSVGNSLAVDKSFDIENTTGSNVLFERGKHHWLGKVCDYTGVKFDISTDTGGSESGGTTTEDGTGTAEDPFKISTADQLRGLATSVAGGTKTSGVYYALQEDIDLGGESNQWTPIGGAKKFQGVFDGQGHTISGLYINNTTNNQGLFGIIENGIIKDLHVEGEITAGINSGGIVGQTTTQSLVINCSYSGHVGGVGAQGYGGIVGMHTNNSYVYNCYNTAKVESTCQQSGGIVGFSNETAFIYNCYNVGEVTSTNVKSSGIVGFTQTAGNVSNNYFLDSCATVGTGSADPSTSCTQEYMQSPTFVTTLNDNTEGYVLPKGSTNKHADHSAKKWITTVGGYPTFEE